MACPEPVRFRCMRQNSGEFGVTPEELAEIIAPFLPGGGGGIVQTDSLLDATFVSIAGVTIPADGSTPQITEGGELLGPLAYTPLDAANILRINFNLSYASNNANRTTFALFDGNTDAIFAPQVRNHTASQPDFVAFVFEVVAGSTIARNYTVRAGSQTSGTISRNGVGGLTNNVQQSSIIVTEFEP